MEEKNFEELRNQFAILKEQLNKQEIVNDRLLRETMKAKKKDIRDLIWDKLPDILDDTKKNRKISTLLTSLRYKGIIKTDSPNQQLSCWILVDNEKNSNKKN